MANLRTTDLASALESRSRDLEMQALREQAFRAMSADADRKRLEAERKRAMEINSRDLFLTPAAFLTPADITAMAQMINSLSPLAPAFDASVAVEEPKPHEAPRPDTPADELHRYASLASELGIRTIAHEELLKAVLADEAIHVYDRAKVEAYMTATVQKEILKRGQPNLVWGWVPLRERDAAAQPPVIRNPFSFGPSIELPRVYSKPVPYPVLCTVKKIVDRMGPDAVEFFVTDYGVKDPDPFLAVKAKGSSPLFVIERWDEPSFR